MIGPAVGLRMVGVLGGDLLPGKELVPDRLPGGFAVSIQGDRRWLPAAAAWLVFVEAGLACRLDHTRGLAKMPAGVRRDGKVCPLRSFPS